MAPACIQVKMSLLSSKNLREALRWGHGTGAHDLSAVNLILQGFKGFGIIFNTHTHFSHGRSQLANAQDDPSSRQGFQGSEMSRLIKPKAKIGCIDHRFLLPFQLPGMILRSARCLILGKLPKTKIPKYLIPGELHLPTLWRAWEVERLSQAGGFTRVNWPVGSVGRAA